MATIEETSVEASVEVRRVVAENVTSTIVIANARSLDADGNEIRTMSRDITAQLTDAKRTAASDLLDQVITRAKAHWGIT